VAIADLVAFAKILGSAVVAAKIWTTTQTGILGCAANLALVLGSFWIARSGLRQPRGLATVLATAVIFWTACILGLELLGSLGVISLGPMLAWGGLILAVGGVARWHRGRSAPEIDGGGTIETLPWDVLAGVALLLAAALYYVTRSLLLGVKASSDAPIYHLYFAARWWKAGRLFLVAAPFGESAATYFPSNGELWFTWLLASWGGERLAKIGQVPFLFLAALAAFGCARALGGGRSASVVAASWFAGSSYLLLYSFEANVDTIFVAGYLMAAYFFLQSFRRAGGSAELVLGALSAGAALGTKAVGVIFIPPLVALVMIGILVGPAGARTKLIRVVVTAAMPLVSGGYWFVRNALLTGNPLYPLDVRLGGHTLWHGWYGPEAMRQSPYFLAITDWNMLRRNLLAVFGAKLMPLWLVALAGAWAINNPKVKASWRWVALFSLFSVANIAAYWILIPYRTQQRFMLQAVGLAVVPLAMTLDRARWIRVLAVLLLGIQLLAPAHWPFARRPEATSKTARWTGSQNDTAPIPLLPRFEQTLRVDGWLQAVASDVFLFGSIVASGFMLWAWRRVSERAAGRGRRAALAVGATGLFFWIGYLDVWRVGLDPRIEFYAIFPDYFYGWQNFEHYSGPAGSRVAYAGTNIPYYLFGQGLRNEVRYVNIDRHRDWLLHDYHREAQARGQGTWPNSRPGWDRIHPDYEAWLDNLDAEGIQLLVVTRVNPQEGAHNVADHSNRFPIERRWADSHPERFQVLYGRAEHDPQFRLFRVRRPNADRSQRAALPPAEQAARRSS
jgi:hypothetical protein